MVTWVTKYYDDLKSRREIIVKTAWDHYESALEILKIKGGKIQPFASFLFYTMKVIDLSMRRDLSDQQFVEELRFIHERQKTVNQIAREVTIEVDDRIKPRPKLRGYVNPSSFR